jgi:hypothetical protein
MWGTPNRSMSFNRGESFGAATTTKSGVLVSKIAEMILVNRGLLFACEIDKTTFFFATFTRPPRDL